MSTYNVTEGGNFNTDPFIRWLDYHASVPVSCQNKIYRRSRQMNKTAPWYD